MSALSACDLHFAILVEKFISKKVNIFLQIIKDFLSERECKKFGERERKCTIWQALPCMLLVDWLRIWGENSGTAAQNSKFWIFFFTYDEVDNHDWLLMGITGILLKRFKIK